MATKPEPLDHYGQPEIPPDIERRRDNAALLLLVQKVLDGLEDIKHELKTHIAEETDQQCRLPRWRPNRTPPLARSRHQAPGRAGRILADHENRDQQVGPDRLPWLCRRGALDALPERPAIVIWFYVWLHWPWWEWP